MNPPNFLRLASVAVACLSMVLCAAQAEPAEFPKEWFWSMPEQQEAAKALVGKPLPEWNVEGWVNGEVTREELKGQIVLIDLWATWCGPCLAAIPHANELAEKYKDQAVKVVGICCTEGADKMEQTAKEKGLSYSTAKDVEHKSKEAYHVPFWPTFILVDREGIVRAIGLQTDFVEDALKALLEEQPAKSSVEPKSEA